MTAGPSHTLPIVACVLAGGASSRMGAPDKGLIDVGGLPMIARVLEAVVPDSLATVISANGDPARFARFGLPILADRADSTGGGPLAGLLAAMDWARANLPAARAVVTVPSDAPFLPAGLVEALADASEGGRVVAVAASEGRRHPVVALWPIALAESVESALAQGERRIGALAAAHHSRELTFPPLRIGDLLIDPFMNVNTMADLDEARQLAAAIDAH